MSHRHVHHHQHRQPHHQQHPQQREQHDDEQQQDEVVMMLLQQASAGIIIPLVKFWVNSVKRPGIVSVKFWVNSVRHGLLAQARTTNAPHPSAQRLRRLTLGYRLCQLAQVAVDGWGDEVFQGE